MSAPLTAAKLREIEERAAAATRGPWTAFITPHVIAVNGAKQDLIHWAGFDQSYASKRKREANAEFIAHARTDVPRLIATVKALRALSVQMAKLASDTPQFDNPLIAWEVQAVRDAILAGGLDAALPKLTSATEAGR